VIDAWLHPTDVVTHDEKDIGFLFPALGSSACGEDNLGLLMEERQEAAEEYENQ
jgi:hypothetical protein